MSDVTHRRVLRGIPRWLVRKYLEDQGARPSECGADDGASSFANPGHAGLASADHDFLIAEGWQARLAQLEDYRIGSLSSGQVEMVLSGEPAVVAALLARLEPRLMRGGG